MQATATSEIDFGNTKVAFESKSDSELRNSYLLFKAIGFPWLVKIGPPMVNAAFAVGLPIKGIIKATVFKQFCGGESIQDCEHTIDHLYQFHVGTILDYSVEGTENETDFDHTADEVIRTIHKAKNNPKIPFSVFKPTGVASFNVLAKVSAGEKLTAAEQQSFENARARFRKICKAAFDNHVRLFIDAEKSWIQAAIDGLVTEMMEAFNTREAIVYNTIQLYRHDRMQFLHHAYDEAVSKGYYLGLKLVRGAYMEIERERAAKMNYPDPIQKTKADADRDYDAALEFCVEHIDRISVCAGTHNENSSRLLARLMEEKGLPNNEPRIYFSQLFGMSDNISFNLAKLGYNVVKYLPYGPVKAVLPYLFRRAQENTSVQGQAGRELQLIDKEMRRRKKR
jgi:proline dehydrogenase